MRDLLYFFNKMGDSRKVLIGRLKSLKGWLTQTINSCDNLTAMPHSVANESFLKARLEKSISDLESLLRKSMTVFKS